MCRRGGAIDMWFESRRPELPEVNKQNRFWREEPATTARLAVAETLKKRSRESSDRVCLRAVS